jgi:hypothetical protein
LDCRFSTTLPNSPIPVSVVLDSVLLCTNLSFNLNLAANTISLYRRGTDHLESTSSVAWRGLHINHLLLLPELLCHLATSCNIRSQRTQLPLWRVGTCLPSRCLAMFSTNPSIYFFLNKTIRRHAILIKYMSLLIRLWGPPSLLSNGCRGLISRW